MPKRVLAFANEEQVKFIDLRFTDLPGTWHHLTIPIGQLNESTFESGIGFDASSLRGWATINESDMLLIPDPTRFWIDPFYEEPTLCLFANVVDPMTKEGYDLDPRSVAARALFWTMPAIAAPRRLGAKRARSFSPAAAPNRIIWPSWALPDS